MRSILTSVVTLALTCTCWIGSADGQAELQGRFGVWPSNATTVAPVDVEPHPISEVRAFAALDDPSIEPRGFRTWEMSPRGWFRFASGPGRFTLLFSEPGHFVPPVLVTNLFLSDELIDGLRVSPQFAAVNFSEKQWDTQGVQAYFQPFVATEPYVTQIGFKLATDGVDGAGPLANQLTVAIHEVTDGDPDQWPQIGPPMSVLSVDCGGPKSYAYSAGWNSQEVPVVPGRTYAVRLAATDPAHPLQAFWQPLAGEEQLSTERDVSEFDNPQPVELEQVDRPGALPACWRKSAERWERSPHRLWITVACTGDELLIPYNKRVHRRFGEFAGSARTWSQTYVAQGHSLASVMLYAAVSGAQPPLSRQRVRLTVREMTDGTSGHELGPIVHQAIAVGEGHYTGDASWGVFARCFAPNRVPLVPGRRYLLEFTSLESAESVGDFVNIKGEASDGRAAFNPYQKQPGDDYPLGTAYRDGTSPVGFDLDLQVLEYAAPAAHWELAVASENYLQHDRWQWWPTHAELSTTSEPQRLSPTVPEAVTASQPANSPSVFRDGSWVVHGKGDEPTATYCCQLVSGLDRRDTYRCSAEIKSTWPFDSDHQCQLGYDLTGQTSDPAAPTIQWLEGPGQHTVWQRIASEPLRPATAAVSVWLRARSQAEPRFPFRAEFRELKLQRVTTSPPSLKKS